uniref:GPI inositol-deacylase n=1 Tax=Panagrellus redivivus TaxID=6233 RepID=A0A7E4WAR9_PANRE
MISLSVFIAISLLGYSVEAAVKWNPFAFDYNDCKMTSMWRYIKYMPVGLPQSPEGYQLYLYGEGHYARRFMDDQKVTGLPVIFVPGNAGSSQQSRSIGSLLQNKTEMWYSKFHFNVFTLHFNHEFSGLSADYIPRQANYLEKAIDYIWNMYKKPPPGIVLIGHSMGGVVIRDTLRRPTVDLDRISVVLTFSSSHHRPPLIVNKKMLDLWRSIEADWNKPRLVDSHIRVVSINGGLKDELIHEATTSSLNPTVYTFSTTEIDRVWVEADHLCIVWCNQLVRHTSRFLFHYAENLPTFREKVDSIIELFYQGPARVLNPVPLPPGVTPNELAASSARCPGDAIGPCVRQGVFVLDMSTDVALVIGPVSYKSLASLRVGADPRCRAVTRHMNELAYYVIISKHDCVDGGLVVDTNKSALWLANQNQIDLKPLNLIYSLLPTSQIPARRFKVARGLRRLPIHLGDVSRSAIFAVSIERQCQGNIYRVIFESGNTRRLDERSPSNAKNLRTIRVYKTTSNAGLLTFVDDQICSYALRIEFDWKLSVKTAILEWINYLPLGLLLSLALFETTSSLTGMSWPFLILGCLASIAVGMWSTDPPAFAVILTLLMAFLVHQVSHTAGNLLTGFAAPQSIIIPTLFWITAAILTVLVTPLLGAIIGSVAGLIHRPSAPASSRSFAALFLGLITLPSGVFFVDLVKRRLAWTPTADLFAISTLLYNTTCCFGMRLRLRQPLRWLALVFATALPCIAAADYEFYLSTLEAQACFASLAFALIVSQKRFV